MCASASVCVHIRVTPQLEGCVSVNISTEWLKVDEGALSSSNNSPWLMET